MPRLPVRMKRNPETMEGPRATVSRLQSNDIARYVPSIVRLAEVSSGVPLLLAGTVSSIPGEADAAGAYKF